MPLLTATPTNTVPDITRGSLCGDGLALVCSGDGLALLCEGDGETDTGGVAGLPAKEAPLGRPSELTRCAGGSTNIPTQPTTSATDAPIPASNDLSTCNQSPTWG